MDGAVGGGNQGFSKWFYAFLAAPFKSTELLPGAEEGALSNPGCQNASPGFRLLVLDVGCQLV